MSTPPYDGLYTAPCYHIYMDTKEAGRMGAAITNKKLTRAGRSKAAKKGWRKRKKVGLQAVKHK